MTCVQTRAMAACVLFVAWSSLTSCNSTSNRTSPHQYPVIHAHHPDGDGGRVTPDASALDDTAGYILSYSAGDQIEVAFTLESDVMQLKNPATMTIVLEAPIRIATDSDGMLVSIEGGPWQRPTEAFNGSFSTSFSILANDPVNRGTVQLRAIAN